MNRNRNRTKRGRKHGCGYGYIQCRSHKGPAAIAMVWIMFLSSILPVAFVSCFTFTIIQPTTTMQRQSLSQRQQSLSQSLSRSIFERKLKPVRQKSSTDTIINHHHHHHHHHLSMSATMPPTNANRRQRSHQLLQETNLSLSRRRALALGRSRYQNRKQLNPTGSGSSSHGNSHGNGINSRPLSTSKTASSLYESLANYYRRNKVDIVDKIDTYNISSTIEAIQSINATLSKDRVMSLPSNQRYHYRVKQLMDYNMTHGTMDIPYNYDKDVSLAKWVSSQRYEYRLMKRRPGEIKSYLTPDRMHLLNAIGFMWNVNYHYDDVEGKSGKEDDSANASDGTIRISFDGFDSLLSSKSHSDDGVGGVAGVGVGDGDAATSAVTTSQSHIQQVMVSSLSSSSMASSSLTKRWMDKYRCLQRYKDEHGHLRVHEQCVYDGTKLGIWVKNQRKNYRPHALKVDMPNSDTACSDSNNSNSSGDGDVDGDNEKSHPHWDRIRMLNDIGFIWDSRGSGQNVNGFSDGIYNAIWMKRYQQLKTFHNEHGHFLIPSSMKELSIWVRTQRVLHRRRLGDKTSKADGIFCSERIGLLNEIGFDWDGKKSLEVRWNETWWTRLGELKLFKEEYGHLNVDEVEFSMEEDPDSQSHFENIGNTMNATKLRHWVKLQRVEYSRFEKREKTSLTAERIEALSELGFVWNRHKELWQEKFKQLQIFQDEFCTFDVPTSIPSANASTAKLYGSRDELFWANTIELGRWVAKQKMYFRRYKRHEELQSPWLERMAQLDKIGFLRDCADELKYENSITTYRGATEEERREVWNRNFIALEHFKDRHGHCMVRHDARSSSHNRLFEWVSLQRRRFRIIRKKMKHSSDGIPAIDLEQLERLEAIEFVFNIHDYKFETNLERYKKDPNDPHLYTFVRRQRELFRAQQCSIRQTHTSLSQERIDKLNGIGFVWVPRPELK